MKENKIRMNKMKLMEKLTNLKKKQTPINREG